MLDKLKKKLKVRIRGEVDLDRLKGMGLTVGKNFNMLSGCIIDYSHCCLITIGDNVTFAPRVHVLAHDASTKLSLGFTKIALTTIGNDVFVGAHAVIMPGVTVGDGAIVGAGSIVTKDVVPGMVVAGNPARPICSVEDYLTKERAKMAELPVFGEEYTQRANVTPPPYQRHGRAAQGCWRPRLHRVGRHRPSDDGTDRLLSLQMRSGGATGDDFMKGLFVTDGRLDERAWSGTSMCLYRELGRRFDLVPLEQAVPGWYDLLNKVANHLPGRKRLAADRTLPWRRLCAAEVRMACERERADFVFAPGSLSIALVDAGVPLFCYIDGTVRAISGSYGGWETSDIEKADALERDALDRAAFVFCSSDWVARSAVADYGVDPSLIGVVGIGANNEIPVRDFDRVSNARLKSLGGGVRILFVGVDWKRKGGVNAFEKLRLLREAGIPATLDVVGCEPEIPDDLEGRVIAHGFLSKKDPDEQHRLEELYLDSHFFLLPTRAECVGSVFCEASSAGLPVLACDVGGVSTVVEDGVNGFLLDGPEAFADTIMRYVRNLEAYRRLQVSSRGLFLERLNWCTIGDGVADRIGRALEGKLTAGIRTKTGKNED